MTLIRTIFYVIATLVLRDINARLDPSGESRREVEELAGELDDE